MKAGAVFLHGSILRHILVMTTASATGLIMLFSVDLVDMYFLSLLGQQELAAAIGFAGTLVFFLTAVSIGLQIAMGALVARAEGRHDRAEAERYCINVLAFSAAVALLLSLPAWIFLPNLLALLGAEGQTFSFALEYSRILLPSTPVLAVGMSAAAALRAIGDARWSTYATVGAALVNLLLDPLFIFGFDMGIAGAALAAVLSRFAVLGIALHSLIFRHRLLRHWKPRGLTKDLPTILPIAGPALLTNIATPLGSAFVLKTIAGFGDAAVAAAAIIGRLTPFAFATVFSLSSAVGPIIGQNAGAGRYDRVRRTVLDAVAVNCVYVLLMWLLLYLARGWIIAAFDASPEAAELISFYLQYLVVGFMFSGILFISNASFNNLKRAHLATCFNAFRVLLGTIPLVYLLSGPFAAKGVLAGEQISALIFGLAAFATLLYQIRQIERAHEGQPLARLSEAELQALAHSDSDDGTALPFSSARSQLGQKIVQQED